MKTSTWAVLLLASLGMGSSESAIAATFATPLVSASPGVCIVTNVGTKPLTTTVKLVDVAGATLTPTLDTCNGTPLSPLASCFTVVDPVPPTLPVTGFVCLVTANSGKVRAAALAITGGGTFTVPATK